MARQTIRKRWSGKKSITIVDTDLGMSNMEKFSEAEVEIGYFPEDGMLLMKKVWENEYGTNIIPSRPFVRRAVDLNRVRIYAYAEKHIVPVLLGEITRRQFMKRIGYLVTKLIKEQIDSASRWAVKNAKSTIAKKGFNRPLVHTKEMRNSIRTKMG